MGDEDRVTVLGALDGVVEKFRKRADEIPLEKPKGPVGPGQLTGNPVSLGPRVLSPEEWAEKQATRAAAAAGTWAKNVKRPRKNPVEAALKAADKRKQKLEESIRTGKWEKAMENVDLDTMYDVITKVGEDGFRRAIEMKKGKITTRVKQLQPLVEEVARTLDEMPVATDADRENKLLAARRLMIELGKKRRGLA